MPSPLRVLIVTPDYPPPPGGIQMLTRNLEVGLDTSEHEVRVVHMDQTTFSANPTDLLPRRRLGYSLKSLATGRFVYLNAVYRRTRRAIRAYDPDVVHSMHLVTWPALVAAHEDDLPTVLSTYAFELRDEALARKAISQADLVHSISQFTASLVEEVTEQRNYKLRIIPPSIDVDTLRSTRSDISVESKRKTVLTIARFVDRKNIETVIEAWRRLDDHLVEQGELVVVGDGPNRDALVADAADVANVRFTGWVDEEEKRRLLARSDVFALVPRRSGFDVEGFGIVYIEAQAVGTPVIGSRHGGAPEAIDGAGHIVEDENDPGELAEALGDLLSDRKQRTEFETAARNRIEKFDISTVTERHVDAYRQLLTE